MIVDPNGRATFGNVRRRINADGTLSQRGNTKTINHTIMQQWLYKIEKISGWNHYGSYDNPHTLIRNGYDALVLYLGSFINNEMCRGYSKYHWSTVNPKDIKVCNDASFAQKYNIDLNDKYYEFDELLTLCLTGDGAGNVKNSPCNVKNVALAFLKVFAFENDLLQCRHAGILVLLSSLGDSDRRVVNYMQQISADLGVYGHVAVWCTKLEAWFCWEYKKFNTGDWAWQHKMSHCCVGSTADYALVNKIVYDSQTESWRGLHKSEYYHCLVGTHVQPYEEIKMAQETSKANREEGKFYSMLTNNIAHGFASNVESKVDKLKEQARRRGTIDKWTEKYEHQQRIKISKKQKHGILYMGNENVMDFECGIFDPNHCMWAIIFTFLHVLMMLMWVVWKWKRDEVQHVIARLGCGTITDQACEYMDGNKSRNVKKWPKFHATGLTLKYILDGFVFALVDAANFAWAHEESKQDGNFAATLIIAVIFRVFTLMRKAFGILFTSQFDLPDDGSTPPKIEELKHLVKLATFIAFCLCPILVCFLCFIFVLCMFYICFMYVLYLFYVCFMFVLCLFYVCHSYFNIGGN